MNVQRIAFWLVLLCLHWHAEHAQAGLAYVGNDVSSSTLAQALQDRSVDRIVITSNYEIGRGLNAWLAPHPLQLNRNISLTGQQGAVLDFGQSQLAVELCAACTWTIANITVLLRSDTDAWSWLLGHQGSKVLLQNVTCIIHTQGQPASAAAEQAAAQLRARPRSQAVPSSATGRQELAVVTELSSPAASAQIHAAVFVEDFSTDILRREHPSVGYTVYMHRVLLVWRAAPATPGGMRDNSTHAQHLPQEAVLPSSSSSRSIRPAAVMTPTLHYISARSITVSQWLQQLQMQVSALASRLCHGTKAPLRMQMLEPDAGRHAAAAAAANATRRLLVVSAQPGVLPAAALHHSRVPFLGHMLFIPAIVVAVGVMMMTSRFQFLRKKQQQPQPQLPEERPFSGDVGSMVSQGATEPESSSGTSHGEDSLVDAELRLDAEEAGKNSPTSIKLAHAVAGCKERPLLASGPGWVLSSSFMHPLSGHINNQDVQFGELLGAGSFAKVYRGSWAGKDVAIKVMLHDGSALTHLNPSELQHLTSLDHPHLIRTFSGVTYTKKAGHTTSSTFDVNPQSPQMLLPDAMKGGSFDQQLVHGAGARSTVGPLRMLSSPAASASGAGFGIEGELAGSPGGFTSSAYMRQRLRRMSAPAPSRLPRADSTLAETWLVQELCDLGTLERVAMKWRVAGEGDAQMLERLSLLHDASKGLKALHTRQVQHGDLNWRNVLVSSSTTSDVGMVAKLSDWGLCHSIKQQLSHATPQTVSIMSHMAPELLRHGRVGSGNDIYAFGIMMWEVYTGQHAFRKLHGPAHLYEAIVIQHLRPKIPDGMPADYQLLMERCWSSDPADRPSADKLVGCLAVMADERRRRLSPKRGDSLPTAATTAGPDGRGGLQRSTSSEQSTLPWLGAAAAQPGGGPVRQTAGLAVSPRAGTAAAAAGGLPMPAPGSLLHHKSCPASAFDALLKSGALLEAGSDDSDASSSGNIDSNELAESILQEEREMLLRLRVGSVTRPGPGSRPMMHLTQPQQRYTDGLDYMPPETDDSYTWVI